jgi:CBS-domain-containing membrane protein
MPDTLLNRIIIKDVISVKPTDTVEKGLNVLNEHRLRCLPVLTDDGDYVGMFGTDELIKHLVPLVGLYGESLGFAVGAAPDLAKKLDEFFPLKIQEFTDTTHYTIKAGTHTWEALRALAKHGSPLPVLDGSSKRFLGLVSEQSAIKTLLEIRQENNISGSDSLS